MRRILPVIIALLILASCAQEAGVSMSAESSPQPSETMPASPSPSLLPSPSPETSSESDTEKYEGEEIVETAMEFLGYRYVYGGESPGGGFDCSGLVYYVYKQHGYLLYRIANDQAKQGELIESEDDLMPGDLLCFMTGKYCPHIGIYIGNGEFIQAMDSANGVVVTELSEYLKRYDLQIRRIVGNMEKKTPEEIEEEAFTRQLAEEALKAAQAKASPAPTPEGAVPTPTPDFNIYIIPTPTPDPTPVPTQPPEPTEPPAEPPSSGGDNSSGNVDPAVSGGISDPGEQNP